MEKFELVINEMKLFKLPNLIRTIYTQHTAVPEQTSEKLNRKTYSHHGRISRGNGAQNPRMENTRNAGETTEREREIDTRFI